MGTEERDLSAHSARVHEASLVILAHCHELLEEDFERMRRGGVSAKLLVTTLDGRMFTDAAAWQKSLRTDHGFLRSTLVVFDYLLSLEERKTAPIVIAREPDDIQAAKRDGKVALVLGAEGNKFLQGRIEILRVLYRLGMRYVAPMWYYDSIVGATQENRTGAGLTAFGRDLIRELNRLGMMIDGNHTSERSLRDILETSIHPIVVSHSGARALNPEQRQLLTDELIREVAAAGGVIGIMFQSLVVKPGYHPATIDELMRQFLHCAELVGTDHVACGPDYHLNDPRIWGGNNPTGPMPEPITWAGAPDVSQFHKVTEALLGQGFTDDDVSKILGGNMLRLFTRVRRDRPLSAAPLGMYERDEIGSVTEGLTSL